MKKVIIILVSLLLVLIAGISMAASTSDSSGSDRTIDQPLTDLHNNIMILDLTVGRKAGIAEGLGLLNESYSREDIINYNQALKFRCNESRYNELKVIAFPGSTSDLIDEYGDRIGPGASYDSDPLYYNETVLWYLVSGWAAGRSEIAGQVLETNFHGNETEKIDGPSFAQAIILCNAYIEEYNKLLKTHCDASSSCRYDELKIKEFDWVYQ
jgi:hypothetical protein